MKVLTTFFSIPSKWHQDLTQDQDLGQDPDQDQDPALDPQEEGLTVGQDQDLVQGVLDGDVPILEVAQEVVQDHHFIVKKTAGHEADHQCLPGSVMLVVGRIHQLANAWVFLD